jgi:RNA polymerase II subunit A-like phosphatase
MPSSPSAAAPSSPTKILLEEAATPGADADKQQAAQDALLEENALVLEAQLEERPLAKMQEELSERGSVNGDAEATGTEGAVVAAESKGAAHEGPNRVESSKERPVRKALLTNDDMELVRVKKVSNS